MSAPRTDDRQVRADVSRQDDARSGIPAAGARGLARRQWMQLTGITVAAIAIYVTLRLLPTGTNLSHMDFRVEGKNALEFCDARNPQFIPVVAARSPVALSLSSADPARTGARFDGTLALKTAGGKPIAPEDLLVVHTRPLHLMVVDPTLSDYQHLHPVPGSKAGEWVFSFTPRLGGVYRLFADFTPAATGRGLYASTDLEVSGTDSPDASLRESTRPSAGVPVVDGASVAEESDVRRTPSAPARFRFELAPAAQPVPAGQAVRYLFRVTADDGGPVPLQPVMAAYAHLVAFDLGRTGFAHLHPMEADPLKKPDAIRPELTFELSIPKPGNYVIWAQVNLGGTEVFVPFTIEVVE